MAFTIIQIVQDLNLLAHLQHSHASCIDHVLLIERFEQMQDEVLLHILKLYYALKQIAC
jgi:hypothetical protein